MNKNFEQMLRLVDYVDGLMVVDKNCIIRHYYTAYPDLVNLRQDEPLNRSLFEIYTTLKREDSYICRALKTGESFINYEQTYINYKGDAMDANCSAVPIKEHGEVVGVIDMVIYKDAHVTERRLSFDISLISALTKSYNTSDQSLEDIVTQDGEMIRIKEKILQTADSDAHVLARPAPARSSLSTPSRKPAAARMPPSSSRTAPPSPVLCWRASSSAPPRAATPGLRIRRVCSSWPTAARCSSTRSPPWS